MEVSTAIDYLIRVLSGGDNWNRGKAIQAALALISFLAGKLFPASPERASAIQSKKAVRSATFSKTKLLTGLQALQVNTSSRAKANQLPSAALPSWLMPLLIQLLSKLITLAI